MGENSNACWPLIGRSFLCKNDEELTNYILIHCVVGRWLLDLVLPLFGISWVLPCSIKELLL